MSRWQEIATGRMGFGYQDARKAGVPWAWIRPFERPVHEINAELEARKEAAERARNWSAASDLLTKAQIAAADAARAQAKEKQMLMQARVTYDERMAALTNRPPLTIAEIERRIQALMAR